ncbi:MAG: hypothetical protein JW986_02640 [Methanotrichaceae archaeon]|nr:hypothetical protein [Methanotrichaceae archaeon]
MIRTVSGESILSCQGTREIEWRCGWSTASIGVEVSVSMEGMGYICYRD